MSIKDTAEILGLKPGTEISNAASIFLDQVKEYMNSAQNNPSNSHAKAEEGALSMLYKYFFQYALEWAEVERQKRGQKENHPNAKDLKKKATEALSDLQDNIVKFSLAYMHLNRSMGFVQQELGAYEVKAGKDKNIEWTSETGTLLQRYRKERAALKAANQRYTQGLVTLKKAEKHLAALEKNAQKAFGDKAAEESIRPYRLALRAGDFDKAKKALKSMGSTKKKFALDKKAAEKALEATQKEGAAYLKIIEGEQDNLRTEEGKIFLKSKEVDIVVNAQKKEIEVKNKYLDKYHQPYMEHKLRSLSHLKEKLLVVGSLDSLITLYIRLIRGMAQPLADIKAVREYEEEVIGHVYYLLGGQFKETESIERWNVESMEEFEESMKDFKGLGKD